MKVVSIVSSPRREGYGDSIARVVEEAAASKGAEVRRIDLNSMSTIRQCQNCEVCKGNGGRCIIRDDIAPVIDAIREADGLVFTTSCQFNDMNGLFKMVLDRFYCFLDMNASTILPKGKKVAIIVTAGADQDRADGIAESLEKVMVQHFFCESVGRIGYNTWMMPKGMMPMDDVLERAKAIGESF